MSFLILFKESIAEEESKQLPVFRVRLAGHTKSINNIVALEGAVCTSSSNFVRVWDPVVSSLSFILLSFSKIMLQKQSLVREIDNGAQLGHILSMIAVQNQLWCACEKGTQVLDAFVCLLFVIVHIVNFL